MDIKINSKDKIGLLKENAVELVTFDFKTPLKSGASLDDRIFNPDTIHYVTPASSSRSTEYEGDLSYRQLLNQIYYEHKKKDDVSDLILSSSKSSIVPCDENKLQRTIAIIKPEAFKYKDVVLRAIKYGGLEIVHQRTLHLTPEQVSEIYENYYGFPMFPKMVVSMSIAPILVLALQAVNAIDKWKHMIGPMGTIDNDWFLPISVMTRQFGSNPNIPDVLHASENFKSAQKESRYFFPQDVLEPLPTDSKKIKDYLGIYLKPTLLTGLTEIVRKKPTDPITSLAEWLLLHNPYSPKLPSNVATAQT